MKRTTVIVIAIAIASVVSTASATLAPPCFLSMGDWGFDDPHVSSMGEFMNRAIGSPESVGCIAVSLTLALGDNFYNAGVESIDDPMWDSVWVKQFAIYQLLMYDRYDYVVYVGADYIFLN